MKEADASPSSRGPRRRILAWHARWSHRLRDTPFILPVLAALVGVVAGATVAALHETAEALHQWIFALPEGVSLSSGAPISWRRLILIPPALGLLTGVAMAAMRWLWPEETIDPIEANALFGGRMSFWASVRLVLATLGSNAAGASVGMEAAYSQIGGSIFSSLGQWLRLRRGDLRILTAAGGGSAIAAAFNAPLTGAFYAFELVLGAYTVGALGPVSLAVVTATITTREIVGDREMFALHHVHSSVQLWEYAPFAATGLLAALVGIAVMRLVTTFDRLIRRAGTPAWARPALGGAAVGLLGLVSSQAMGSGHGAIRVDLATTWSVGALALLLLVKILASAVSLGAGFRGGLFSTSLLMGSFLGAIVARIVGMDAHLPVAQSQAFSLVGMGALGTAIIGAPITMTVLTLETTGDATATFGVLTAVAISSIVVRATFGYSFATWRFHLRGISIRGAHDVGWLGELTAGRLMDRGPPSVPQDLSLAVFRRAFPLDTATHVFVVDEEGGYLGVVDVPAAHNRDLDEAANVIVVGDMMSGRNLALTAADSIRTALARFETAEIDVLPVIESSTDRRLAGSLSEAYALRRYAEEMARRRSDELGEHDIYGAQGDAAADGHRK
jgi:chloride channel protein, CIC family